MASDLFSSELSLLLAERASGLVNLIGCFDGELGGLDWMIDV